MSRLPEIDPDNLTEAQQRVYEKIAAGPRGGVRGPFAPLLLCPEVADGVQQVGAWLRFEGSLSGDLRELAILITARVWSAQYEWYAHAPIAEKEGLDPTIMAAVAERREPDFNTEAEATVYAYCQELHGDHRVSDATYGQAVAEFGEAGVMELTALCGHYTTVAMTLNVFGIEPPEGERPLPD